MTVSKTYSFWLMAIAEGMAEKKVEKPLAELFDPYGTCEGSVLRSSGAPAR